MTGRQKRNRVLLSLALAVVLILALVLSLRSCTGQVPDADEPPTLTIWHPFGAGTVEGLHLAEMVAQLSPLETERAYQLELHYYEPAKLQDDLTAAEQAGALPVLLFTEHRRLPELASRGLLATLHTMDDHADVANSLVPSALETGHHEGSAYGLPFSLAPQMILYNPELFVTSSQVVPTHLDNFGCIVKGIATLEDDIYGLGVVDLDPASLAPFLWCNGGQLVNGGQTRASGYLDSGNNLDVVRMFNDFYRSGALYHEKLAGGSLLEQFGTGKLGMVIADPTFAQALQRAYPDFNYDVMSVPLGQGGLQTVLGSTLVTVPATPNSDLGWALAKAILQDEAQNALAASGALPANAKAVERVIPADTPLSPFRAALMSAKPLPSTPAWAEMEQAFCQTMNEMLSEGKDADACMTDLAKLWDELLA